MRVKDYLGEIEMRERLRASINRLDFLLVLAAILAIIGGAMELQNRGYW